MGTAPSDTRSPHSREERSTRQADGKGPVGVLVTRALAWLPVALSQSAVHAVEPLREQGKGAQGMPCPHPCIRQLLTECCITNSPQTHCCMRAVYFLLVCRGLSRAGPSRLDSTLSCRLGPSAHPPVLASQGLSQARSCGRNVRGGKQKPIRSLKAKVRTHALSLLRILLAKVSPMTQPDVRGQERYSPLHPRGRNQ